MNLRPDNKLNIGFRIKCGMTVEWIIACLARLGGYDNIIDYLGLEIASVQWQ